MNFIWGYLGLSVGTLLGTSSHASLPHSVPHTNLSSPRGEQGSSGSS